MNINKQKLIDDIGILTSRYMSDIQGAYGNFFTKTRNTISISDKERREAVQKSLNHAVGLLSVAHAMSLFEDSIPESIWVVLFDADVVVNLQALKHIKSCASHGFTGKRSVVNIAQFNAIMESDKPFKGVDYFDTRELFLTEDIAYEAFNFLRNTCDLAVVAAYNL